MITEEIKVRSSVMVAVDLIDDPDWENPQEMSDSEFNELVSRVRDIGFTDPVQLVKKGDRFVRIAGDHRIKAAKYLGMAEVPAFVFEESEWDKDKQIAETVRDNVVRGKLNPLKFSRLFDQLSAKYSREMAKMMVGLSDDERFRKFYKEVREALPAELRAKLDAAKAEIKTIDDLSLILNRIFSEHGDDLKMSFMVFTFGKQDHVYLKCRKDVWKTVQLCVDTARKLKMDFNDVVKIGLQEDLPVDKIVEELDVKGEEEHE